MQSVREDGRSALTDAGPLVDVLLAALRALGDAGRAEDAGRLAGRAWSALRRECPEQAERVNWTMHRLARQERAGSTATEE